MTLSEIKKLSTTYSKEWGFSMSKEDHYVAFWGHGDGLKEATEKVIKQLNRKLIKEFDRHDLEFILVYETPSYSRTISPEWGLMLVEKGGGSNLPNPLLD